MNAFAQFSAVNPGEGYVPVPPPPAIRTLSPKAATTPKDDVLMVLRGLGTTRSVMRGEPIFKQGDHASAVYRVLSGAVALWHTKPNGRRHVVDFRLPGEFFGVVHRPEYTISADATADTVLVAYKRGQIDEICDALPSFRRSIAALVAEPVLSKREIALAERQTSRERIVEFLLAASARGTDGAVSLPVSRRDVADHLDLPAETVARVLHDLAGAGSITLSSDNEVTVTKGAQLHTAS